MTTDTTALDGKESHEYLDNILQHMKKFGGPIERYLAHLVFLGLPASGKTTLIARLLDLKDILIDCPSTGVMNSIITVDVMEDLSTLHAANVEAGSTITWREVDMALSCLRQMGVQCFVEFQPHHSESLSLPLSEQLATGSEVVPSENTPTIQFIWIT